MAYKPVGVDTDTSLFPTRVMNALKNIFALKNAVSAVGFSGSYSDLKDKPVIPSSVSTSTGEPLGLSTETKNSLQAIYLTYDGTNIKKNGSVIQLSNTGNGLTAIDLDNGSLTLTSNGSSSVSDSGNGSLTFTM